MDMSRPMSDKRRPSALDVLARVKPEDPVEKVQRLEKEIMELRAFQAARQRRACGNPAAIEQVGRRDSSSFTQVVTSVTRG